MKALLLLLIWIYGAVFCAALGSSRGHDGVTAFYRGLVFPVLGIIYYLCIGVKKGWNQK